MKFPGIAKWVLALFLAGVLLNPAYAAPKEEIVDLDEAINAGYISYSLTSLGRERGEMAEVEITRKTKNPMTIIVPLGMVFSPAAQGYSSLIISQEHLIPLVETRVAYILRGYSLDYPKDPPKRGMALSRAKDERYEDSATLIAVGNSLGQGRFFYRDLPLEEYKEMVIQRAIWVMATNYGYNKTNLKEEIVRDFGEGKTIEEIDAITDHLWTDIEKTLKETHKAIAEKAEKLFHIAALTIERSTDTDWPNDKVIMELRTSEKQGDEPLKNRRIRYGLLLIVEPKDGTPAARRIEGKTRTYAEGRVKIEIEGGLGQNLKAVTLKVIDLKEIDIRNLREVQGEWRYDPGHPQNQEAVSIKF